MSQNWRFMLKTCQSILNVCPVSVLQSLKIITADLSCFNRSRQTPSRTRTPHPRSQVVPATMPPPLHTTWRKHYKAPLPKGDHRTDCVVFRLDTLAHAAETWTFGHCSSRLDLNRYKLEIKRFDTPLPILWAMNLQNHLLFGNLMQCQAQ